MDNELAIKHLNIFDYVQVLWAIFDQVDDTVLINKYITSVSLIDAMTLDHCAQEIANNVGKLLEDRWGCLCLEYMVHPRDGRSMDYNVLKLILRVNISFLQIIQELQIGDDNPHSKKDKKNRCVSFFFKIIKIDFNFRYAEIFRHLVEPLLTYFAANMHSALMGDMSALTSHVLHKALELPSEFCE